MVDRSKLKHWFHKNKFFEVTPLNGWSFVYAAKSTTEILFWYALITILMVLTVLNIQQVTQHYLSEPVKYKVAIHASTEKLHMPDMVLTATLPIFDWLPDLPLKPPNTNKTSTGIWSEDLTKKENDRFRIFNDFLCQMDNWEYPLASYLLSLNENILTPKHLIPFHYEMLEVDRHAGLTDFSDPAILQKWKLEMKKAKNEYYTYWANVLSNPMAKYNREIIYEKVTELQSAGLSAQGMNTLIKLFTLKTIETGVPSEPAKRGLMKDDLLQSGSNLTAAELLKDTLKSLANMLHLEMEPRGSVFLTDWNYVNNRFEKKVQKFVFLIRPPGQVREVKIRFYLRSFMWLVHVLQALESVVKNVITPDTGEFDADFFGVWSLSCSAEKWGRMEMSDMVYDMLSQWENGFSDISPQDPMMTLLEPVTGSHATLVQRGSNTVSFAPYMAFNSKIHGCYNGSFEGCKRECITENIATECGCLPWNLAHLLNSSDWQTVHICERPCEIAPILQQCNTRCRHIMNNTCYLLHLQKGAQFYNYFGLSLQDLQFVDINIMFPELYPYAEVMAEPKFARSDYLSLVGGALEFWSATDVLGLIHLIIFIILAFCARLTKTNNKQKMNDEKEHSMSLERIEKRYSILIEDIHHQLQNILKNRDEKCGHILTWLRGNDFYAETPFTGYSYIVEAGHIIEVVWWYLVIGIFTTVAAYNLITTIQEYIAQETTIEIIPSTIKEQLPNVRVEMELPLVILTEYNPNVRNINPKTDLAAIAFEMEVDFFKRSDLQCEKWKRELNGRSWKQLISINKTPAGTDEFHKKISDHFILFNTWENDNSLKRAKELSWSERLSLELEMFSGPQTHVDGLIFKLLLLEAIKTGEPVGKQLGSARNASAHAVLKEIGATVEEVFSDAVSQLMRILHVRGARMEITDLDFKLDSRFKLGIQLEFQSTGPPDAYVEIDLLVDFWNTLLLEYEAEILDSLTLGDDERWTSILILFDIYDYYSWFRAIAVATLHIPNVESGITLRERNNEHFEVAPTPTEYAITTQLSYKTEKNSCEQASEEHCIEECLVEEYLLLCKCIPWSVPSTHRREHRLCNQPCRVQRHKCEIGCRGAVCMRSFNEINSRKTDNHSHSYDRHLFQFRFTMMQNLHMHFLETYQHSLGTFMAQIGGILEFWMGFNVFALVHCISYAIQFLYMRFVKQSEPGPSGLGIKSRTMDLQHLLEGRETVRKLSGRFLTNMRKVRKTAKDGTLKLREAKTGLRKIYRNNFFKTTSITGFQFIVDAASTGERMIWAVLVMVFCVITIVNVYGATARYALKPTTISSSISHRNQVPLGNLSVKFEQSLLQFSDLFPNCLQFLFVDDNRTLSTTHQMICEILRDDRSTIKITESYIRYHFLNTWNNYGDWNLDGMQWTNGGQLKSPEETLNMWMNLFAEGSRNLVQFLENYKNEPYPKNPNDQYKIAIELIKLLNAPLKQRGLENTYAFLILDAFDTGHDPQKRLHDLYLRERQNIELNEPNGQTVPQMLQGVGGLEFVKTLEQDMDRMILVRVVNEPEAKVNLQSWNYHPTKTENNPNSLMRNEMEFRITMPLNNARKKIHIVVYSFLRMWHDKVSSTIRSYAQRNKLLAKDCIILNKNISNLIQEENELFDQYILNPGNHDLDDVEISTDNMITLSINGRRKTEVLVKATGSLESKTDNCSMISIRQCMDKCRRSNSLTMCGCQPWGLLYLEEAGPVCTQPCVRDDTDCARQCDQLIQHPCYMLLCAIETGQS